MATTETIKPKDSLIPTAAHVWNKQTLDSLGVTYERNLSVRGFEFPGRVDEQTETETALNLAVPDGLQNRTSLLLCI